MRRKIAMEEEMMEVVNSEGTSDWPGRWDHLEKLLSRDGPLKHPEFEPGPGVLDFMRSTCNVLVVGAGGLGCEILKGLALSGFGHLEVIDMDTIDLSNLNRQFLFRRSDVGRSKAVVAAEFINKRVPGCQVVPHYNKIQDFEPAFYKKFHIIVCGLDSVVARRWMNGMIISLLRYDSSGQLDTSTIIPLVDGGTEGFKGNVRVVLPGMTACIDCTLELYPPQVTFPLCTIAHTPRLPEHCIEFAKILQWPQEKPFGGVALDGDNPEHIQWLLEHAQERAAQFGISGVTYRLTQGVVKRIIPAVASTNAVIAAACVTEVFKIASSCASALSNYMVFNDADGLYTYSFEAERNEKCLACSVKPHMLYFRRDSTLQDVLDYLCESPSLQMRSPGVTVVVAGKTKTLYMRTPAVIEQATRANLKRTLSDLGLVNGHQLVVADVTTPKSLLFNVVYEDS